MRLAKSKLTANGAVNIPSLEPVAKTSQLSNMRQLLRDEHLNLPLMEEEERRPFDDELDLDVPEGQTEVKLVPWIRFHRIYHSGRMQIRYLSRQDAHVILVMGPDEIVAADNSRDIQTLQGDENAPEIVKQLLEPSISPEESSRYAFLLCDGSKWKLVDCLTLEAQETPTVAESQQVEHQPSAEQPVEPANVIELQQRDERDQKRFEALEQKVNEAEKKLDEISLRLFGSKPIGNLSEPELGSNGRQNTQDSNVSNLPDLVCPQIVKNPTNSTCSSAEAILGVFSNFGTSIDRSEKLSVSSLSDAPPFTNDTVLPSTATPSIPELPEATPPSEIVFPNVVTAKIVSVKSNGNATLEIVVEEMTGRHKELCPSGASMLLPLHNIDDRWGLVSLDHIPKCGFQIPGLSLFISGDVLGRAASTAIERKTSIRFRFKLKNSESIFNQGIGVNGNPQLPRHVFVGPFAANHLENCSPQPCMSLITLTEPAPTDSDCSNTSSLPGTLGVKSTEPTGVSSAENVQPEDFVPPKDKDGEGDASSEQDKAVDATFSSKTPTAESELPETNTAAAEEPQSPIAPPPSEVKVPKSRKFTARVRGLPSTTLTVFPDKVIVKHPLNPEEVVNFDSVDNAKGWLQKLAVEELNRSEQSETSNLSDDSNSGVCGHNETRGKEETANGLKGPVSPHNSIQRQLNLLSNEVNCVRYPAS